MTTPYIHSQNVVNHNKKSYGWMSELFGRRNKGNKEKFYLMLHSTHFLGVICMVRDHPDNKRENPLSLHGLLFPISHCLFFTSCRSLVGMRNNNDSIKRAQSD